MRAIVYRKFGSTDELRVEEIEKPSPSENEVLVAVHAAAVNTIDWYLVRAKPKVVRLALGLRKPKRLGVDFAGTVESVGKNVVNFKKGDRVFGAARGSFAEFLTTSEDTLGPMPRNTSFDEAAAAPVAGLTAIQGLRDLKAGDKILVNGASGGLGTFAIQVAKALGAHVTAVCSSRNLERAWGVGADCVIDYTKDDFTKNATRYDVVFDIIGNHSWSDCRRVVTRGGTYVVAGGPPARGISLALLSPFTRGALASLLVRPNSADLGALREMIESGAVNSVIDRRYSLEQTGDAVRYIAAGHTRGKVVISIASFEAGPR